MTMHKYIPSIDGLRALAVLSVILFHGFPKVFPGGFIGVDVFFVISGYLITQIIVDKATSNQFSFVDFYSRRIRRIFPALILVFMAVYGLGWFVMLPNEFMQLGKHIAAGAAFISNWVYWLEAGYFDELAELKPLLNLWSLGVEEQFYIFWPCIILLALRLRLNLRKVLIGIIAASFLINVLFVKTNPSATFYLPFARTWELGLGGLLAIYPARLKDIKINSLIAILGLVGILSPIFYLSPKSVFPGWSALPPVLGAVLFLATVKSDAWPIKIFSNRWMVAIGLISYPLYLWHWPVLSLGRLMKGSSLSQYETVWLLLISLFLAFISYALIEKRVRKLQQKTVVVLCLLMAVIGFQGWNTLHREGLEYRLRKYITVSDDQRRDFEKWEKKGMLPVGNCQPGFIYPEAHVCATSNASLGADIAVFGDSHAFSSYWGIAKAYENQHVTRLIGQGACLPFLDAGQFGIYPNCQENINQQIQWIADNPTIKTVFIFHRYPQGLNTSNTKDFELSIQKTFNRFLSAKKQVIYAYSVPELGHDPRLCVGELPLGRNKPSNTCSVSLVDESERQRIYRSSIKNIQSENPDIKFFDPSTFMCPNGLCGAVIDGKVMFTDTNHLSESGSNIQGLAIKKQFPLN
ncbi:acyltransferase family protein [Polynucleobacter sp. MWH-UH25E]|uniref:acyltransferase family protein n=1 Tax=Polynucleobacter sp. MWH-UH25E TaxID=1855616 RepID=UPI001BFCE4F6|nr:acyltransferase family protein [Polynucleobacter sp. MWH-UH25E]QWD62287.1 acyltransferase [Polynucleobacter sp. MWH-UH25E]